VGCNEYSMYRRLNTISSDRGPQPGLAVAAPARNLSLLVQFSYLQLLDILTTLLFLTSGVKEANPVVRLAMAATHSPLVGLLILKVLALAFALYCVFTARARVLKRINLFFALLVIWNLVALLGT
jgi:hypothetical protein